jgi:hypothetical protein
MTGIKLPFGQITLSLILAWSSFGFSCQAIQVLAQHAPTALGQSTDTSENNSVPVAFDPPPPPDQGAPGDREGTAGRCDNCPPVYPPLTALVPTYKTSDQVQSVWGFTLAEHPTFWFYIPEQITPDNLPVFVLQDENSLEIYKTTLQATGMQPGVVSFHLPETVAPLEIGKRYHWIFAVEGVFVDGWVERIPPNPKLLSQLKTATPRERVALYAANRIWYEALTTLAVLRQEKPKDTTLFADWATLLGAINLNDITPKPIVQCCIPQN